MATDKDRIKVLLVKELTKKGGYDSLLEKEGRFEIVGETNNINKAIELASEHTPDLIVLENSNSNAKTIESIKKLKENHAETSVILISYQAEDKFIKEALHSGASGYIVRTHLGNELSDAVSRIEHGQVYLNSLVPKSVIKEFIPSRVGRRPESEGLTERQKEILKLLSQGCTNKQIAKRFSLSVKTIDAHRANIMNKLKIHDLPGLVKYAIRTGLTSIDE